MMKNVKMFAERAMLKCFVFHIAGLKRFAQGVVPRQEKAPSLGSKYAPTTFKHVQWF